MKSLLTNYRQSINPPYSKSDLKPILLTLLTVIGISLSLFLVTQKSLIRSNAAGAPVLETESGTISGNVTIGNDANASGGKYIQLGQIVTGVTPTQSPTPTTLPGASRCPAYPAFPDANCTGVVPGTTLAGCSTSLNTANATYDKCIFNGGIDVNANNITITNSRILGVASGSGSGLRLIDVEINGGNTTLDATNGMSDYSCTRCNVYNVGKGFTGSGFSATDSYVHDLYGTGPADGTGSHDEAILGSGNNIVIEHNNLVSNFSPSSAGGGMSSAVSLYTHGTFWGPMDNVLIEKNRLETKEAVYCLYGGYSTTRAATNVRVLSNYFYVNPGSGTCGTGGPIVGWKQGGGNIWSGNSMLNNLGTTSPLPEPASNTY